MNGLVSIIVPVYNAENYLNRCLESISHQTYSDIEIILVNDGSTDNSVQICEHWQKTDERIRYFYQDNTGVSSARNLGIEHAEGDYITFVDSDDYLSPDFVFYMLSSQEKSGADLVISNAVDVYEDGKTEQGHSIRDHVLLKPDEAAFHFMISDLFSRVCWGSLYKKSVIGSIRFDTAMRIAEDSQFLWDVINACEKIYAVPEKHYFYFIHSASVVHSGFCDKYYDELKFCERLVEINRGNGKLEGASELMRYRFVRRLLAMEKLDQHDRQYLMDELSRNYKSAKKYFSIKNFIGHYRFLLKCQLVRRK